MVSVTMSGEAEALLRQVSADLDVPVEEAASMMLESALLMSLTR